MPWFVPTQGDPLFLAVEANSLSDLGSLSKKLSHLTGRLRNLSNREARAIGQDLREQGALSEAPESLAELRLMVIEDTAFAEFAMSMGIESPYRKALPEEIRELEQFPMVMWPLRLHEGGLT